MAELTKEELREEMKEKLDSLRSMRREAQEKICDLLNKKREIRALEDKTDHALAQYYEYIGGLESIERSITRSLDEEVDEE